MDEKTIARFWKYVDKSGECWLWTGANTYRYGAFWNGKKYEGSHRFAYRLHTGEEPGSLSVCHKCDNGLCVRGDHLWLGTVAQNTRDMVAKDRSPLAGITNTEAFEMRKLAASGALIPDLAERFGVSYAIARAATIGETYPDCGHPPVKANAAKPLCRTVSDEQIRQIRAMTARGLSQSEIADALGLRRWTVSNVRSGKSGKNVA